MTSPPASVTRNIVVNFLGLALPILVGLACIPFTLHELGIPRFGLLSIAWVLIGYVSIFDLGLGRALTQAVSQRLGSGRETDAPPLIGKSLAFMLAVSVAGGLVLAVAVPWAAGLVTAGNSQLAAEASGMFLVVALAIPPVVLSSGLRGALEAYERFGAVAMVRAATGVWTYLAPFLLVLLTSRLEIIVLALVAGRYLAAAVFGVCLFRQVRRTARGDSGDAGPIGDLLRFGGWMTVSNAVSPLMTYMDRFFVSAIAGLSHVAYYTTPFDMISRVSVIPEAVFGVIFPRMARSVSGDGLEADRLYQLSLKLMGGLMFAVSIAFIAFGATFLALWLNPEFAEKSALIMSLLSIGMFVSSVARPPYNLIQARGRADITAKLHLAELPLYIACLVGALHVFGAIGAAVAWMARVALDYVLLSVIAKRHTTPARLLVAEVCVPLAFAVGLIGLALIPDNLARVAASLAGLLVAAAVYGLWLLTPSDRRLIWNAAIGVIASRRGAREG